MDVALLNPDVALAPDWLERTTGTLADDARLGAVACKMVDMADPRRLYDTGDLLRRDGAAEQRGRFAVDDGRYDGAGKVFAACAGAALYRRAAVEEVGGFEERFFLYLEDVELGLRLRLAGWACGYEPAVARRQCPRHHELAVTPQARVRDPVHCRRHLGVVLSPLVTTRRVTDAEPGEVELMGAVHARIGDVGDRGATRRQRHPFERP